jgi:hypothetical protein
MIGMADHVKLITVSQHHHVTGHQTANEDIWIKYVHESLSKSNTVVLLHIVDSSKLGRRNFKINQAISAIGGFKRRGNSARGRYLIP